MSWETRSSTPIIFALMLLLVAAVSAGWWLFNRHPEGGADPLGEMSREESLQLVEWKNTGIARLENGDYEESARIFSTIGEKLPESPLASRNLAIARVLAFKQELNDTNSTPAKQRAKRDAAIEALHAAIQTEPKSAAVRYVVARLYTEVAERDFANADWRARERAALTKATELDPQMVGAWFQLFESMKFGGKDVTPEREAELIEQVYKLRPRNLTAIRMVLIVKSRARREGLRELFLEAEPVIRAVALRLPPPQSAELLKPLDAATAGFKSKDEKLRQEARQFVVPVANVLNGKHATQVDRRELEPHELEFLIADFNAKFYARADLPEPKLPAAIAVKFRPAKSRGLPDFDNVRAVKPIDFNLDSTIDLIVLHGRQTRVFGYAPAAKQWGLVTEIELPFESHHLVAVDLDFDVPPPPQAKPGEPKKKPKLKPKPRPDSKGHPCVTADVDLVVYGPGGVALLRNELDKQTGRRKLTPVAQPPALKIPKDVLRVAAVDFDHDSDLDLVLSTQAGIVLWRNRGDMTFEDVTKFSEMPKPASQATVVVPIDFNRDVLLDVVLSGPEFAPAGYLENIRHGRFRYREFGKDFAPMAKAATLAPVEADGNVSWDWVAAGINGVALTRTRTVGNGRYQFLKSRTIHDKPVRGATLLDYDNDGCQDVLAWSADGLLAFRGGPDGQFAPAMDLFADSPRDVTAVATEDLDGDGDLDLAVVAGGKLRLLHNAGGNTNGWVRIALHAQEIVKTPSQRCNIHGVGSLLELKAGTAYQARIVTGPVTHFGLGQRKSADTVRVLWTNGIPQHVLTPQTRLAVCSRQSLLTGSCPYLYTWTGTKFEFFTDLLWAAPIGLQFADGTLAPSREWEYLKIPGDRLKQENGEYRLQITEELWEAGYFDSVKLFAVDHPANVRIFTNEKVGPASIAAHKIHTVRDPRIPVAARDQRGRNVLPLIQRRDGRFLQAYDYRLTQGFTPEHWLELDLGQLKDPQQITLFLTGWIFPTDTSINVWLSRYPRGAPLRAGERPGISAPQPPSLWVPDKNGEWKNVIPYTGFPGGKTKTIAIDLSGKFLTNDYRVRIRTSMELRWDEAFFTVDEAPAKHRVQPAPLLDARLFDRGFSRRIEGRHRGPENYDHTIVHRRANWPPMEGRFTRYGDVTELVQTDDDRLVVLGAGDAMTLRFAAPKTPPPPGWTRDFIIRNVGWDKDAGLNTVLGQSSEPLPFRKMRGYPIRPNDTPPNSPAYRDYLRKYQTRRQRADRFWREMRTDQK